MIRDGISVSLSTELSAFGRLVMYRPVMGIFIAPFCRFMPLSWLVTVKVEVIPHG